MIYAKKVHQFLEQPPIATFKQPFATCDEWRMGWATLV